jgi:hypothetical protein
VTSSTSWSAGGRSLFSAAFAREVLRALEALRQALRTDPQGCLLHNFARAYFWPS